jgi:hypothetical protein
LIDTGNYNSEAYRKYAKMVADHFDLAYEEIPGSRDFLERLIRGEWEKDFVVVQPGETVQYDMFYNLGGLK